jgi:hypothetical protein
MTDVETVKDPAKVGKEFKNKITFNGIPYETSVFLAPLTPDSDGYKYIINKFSTRKQFDKTKGKMVTCLGTTASIVKSQLDTVNVSAYVFANESKKASADQASGSLQVFNWSVDLTAPAQAWICDLCRNAPDPSKKSASSPIKPTLHLFDQIAHYVFGKTESYLMVNKHNESDLRPIYEKYGFVVDTGFAMRDDDGQHIVMKKTIVPDPTYASFPFAGSPKRTRSRKTTKRRKTSKSSSSRSSASPKP